MTNEILKKLGLAYMQMSLPLADGVMDGHSNCRLGGLYFNKSSYEARDIDEFTWPDFSDDITCAWLISAAIHEFSRNNFCSLEEYKDGEWFLHLTNGASDICIDISSSHRAEVWVNGLIKIKELNK